MTVFFKFNFTFFILIFLSFNANATAPFSFSAYFRSSAGSNLKGGQLECYTNPGSQGNEFRLGNECGVYSEASFISQLVDPENANGISSQAVFTFAYVYENKTDFEVTNNNWVLRQGYIELASTEDAPGKFWMGKRFYRWSDVHSDDFFPVSFNGPGAGWGGLKTSVGNWDFGIIQNSESKEINGSTTAVTTSVKNAAKTTFHVKLEEMPLTENSKLSFWGVVGVTPATRDTTAPSTRYKAATGGFLAIKDNYKKESIGNEFGIAFGNSVLASMSAQGELSKDCNDMTDASCTVEKSNRLRLWNALTVEQNKWSTQVATVFDEYDKRTNVDSKIRWTSISIQPLYYLTDHVGIISVLGFSNVLDESDGLGNRTLTRFTVGPQLALGKGYYSRPVLRALYSNTSWNKANKTSFSTSSSQGERNAQSLVAQVEVWF
jgi:maltoporin